MGKQKFSAVIWFYLKHNSTESPQLEYVARNSNAQLHSDDRDIVKKIAQLSVTIKLSNYSYLRMYLFQEEKMTGLIENIITTCEKNYSWLKKASLSTCREILVPKLILQELRWKLENVTVPHNCYVNLF